jgi:hypothetical protein
MKKGNLVLVMFLLVSLLLSAGICNGAVITPKWVAYDYTTKVELPTGWEEANIKAPMADFCSIKNGVLVMDTSNNPSATPAYKLPITPADGLKFTIVIKAKADSDFGMDFDFRAGYRERIQLLGTGLKFATSGGTKELKTTDWHTYFLSFEYIKDGGATKLLSKVYVDGDPTPFMQGTSPATDSYNGFRLGDGSSSGSYTGEIDWLFWTFDGAYSPDQVTLPAGFSLK